MTRYIDAEILSDALRHLTLGETDAARATMKITHYVSRMPTADVVEVVRCKDCKHRPIDTQEEGNGFDYEFPEEYGCPGYCDDGYYSQRFKDDFYCAWGEREDT